MSGETMVEPGRWASSRVAILYGGESDERDVSLKTGRAFYDALLRLGYQNVELIDATGAGLLQVAQSPPDVALLALHGGLGEDGSVQGMLECLQVPYTGSGVHACAVAMNKSTTKRLWRTAGVSTPEWEVLRRDQVEHILSQSSLDARVPCVVKPALGGSSVGVTLVERPEDYYGALERSLKCPGPVMIEAMVEGRELTVGLMDNQVMGIVEIIARRGFYDYTAKYGDPLTEYQFPASLPDRVQAEVRRQAELAGKVVGCRGVARVDLMLDFEDRPWFLEVNTTPGMTATSLVPKIAQGAGVSFEHFTQMLLNKAKLDADVLFE